jgi:hypothetical protein
MAAMRRNERKGPGMVTSSEESEEAARPEGCAPADCPAGIAGVAARALRGTQKNAHKRIVRGNADRQVRTFIAESSIQPTGDAEQAELPSFRRDPYLADVGLRTANSGFLQKLEP